MTDREPLEPKLFGAAPAPSGDYSNTLPMTARALVPTQEDCPLDRCECECGEAASQTLAGDTPETADLAGARYRLACIMREDFADRIRAHMLKPGAARQRALAAAVATRSEPQRERLHEPAIR